MMDFAKISAAIDEALAEPTEKAMTREEFEAYAKDQVNLAKSEHESGDIAGARERLIALKEQCEAIAKFEFKPGELPTVKFYRAKEQKLPHAMPSMGAKNQETGSMSFMAKAMDVKNLLEKFLSDGSAKVIQPGQAPAADPGATKPLASWPEDLASEA